MKRTTGTNTLLNLDFRAPVLQIECVLTSVIKGQAAGSSVPMETVEHANSVFKIKKQISDH